MRVIAHRGASLELPENTMAAFRGALEAGADMIEMDVRASGDGVLYVSHDPVSVGRLPLLSTSPPSWAEIRATAGGSGRYPALAEVLDELAGRIELNLELKERRVANLLLADLQRRGRSDAILISAFDPRIACFMHDRAPQLRMGLLARRLPFRLRSAIARIDARAIHVHRRALSRRALRLARELGLPVYVWTVDDLAEIARLKQIGAAGVFTNDPRAVRAFLAGNR